MAGFTTRKRKNVYLGQYKTEEEAREVLTKFREKDTILE